MHIHDTQLAFLIENRIVFINNYFTKQHIFEQFKYNCFGGNVVFEQ